VNTTRQTLQEIFDRAGIARAKTPQEVRRSGFALARHMRRLTFAQCLVKNGFDVKAAYREFNPRSRPSRSRHWECMWLKNPLVHRCVLEIVQEATEGAKERMRDDLEGIREINAVILRADATQLIEQVVEKDELGNSHIYTRFKPVADLTPEQRLVVYKVRLKNGEVVMMEPYSRADAIRTHLELLEILEQRGGSDQSWTQRFKQRISAPRQRRIDLEVEVGVQAGKVVRLPGGEEDVTDVAPRLTPFMARLSWLPDRLVSAWRGAAIGPTPSCGIECVYGSPE
jgi:hypothetical protein